MIVRRGDNMSIILYDKNKNKLVVREPGNMTVIHKKCLLVQGAKSVMLVNKGKGTLMVQKPRYIVITKKHAIVEQKQKYMIVAKKNEIALRNSGDIVMRLV